MRLIPLAGGAICVAAVLLTFSRILSGATIYLDDTASFNLPLKAFTWSQWRLGEVPLWWPNVMCGTPIFGEGQAGVLHPLNLLGALFADPVRGYNFVVILTFLVASLGAYCLARCMQVSVPAAVVAGVVYGLGGPMVSHHPHIMIIQTAALLPWTALCVLGALGSRYPLVWAVLAAELVALQWLAFSPQMLIVGLVVVAWLALWKGHEAGGWPGAGRGVAMVAGVYAAGTLAAAVQLWPVAEYWKALGGWPGERTFDRPPWPLKFVIFGPVLSEVFGGWRAKIWGFHWSETCLFSGVAATALAVAALAGGTADPRRRWLLAWSTLGAAALAFGTNYLGTPAQRLVSHLPFVQGMRCHTRVAFAVVLALAMLAAFATDAVPGARGKRRRTFTAAVVVLFAILAALFLPAIAARGPAIWQLRASFWREAWSPSGPVFLRTAIAGASLVLALGLKLPSAANKWLIAAVVSMEMVLFAAGTIWTKPASYFAPPQAVLALTREASAQESLSHTGPMGRVFLAVPPKFHTNLFALWGVHLFNGRFAEAIRPQAVDAFGHAAVALAQSKGDYGALSSLGIGWVATRPEDFPRPPEYETPGDALILDEYHLARVPGQPQIAWAPAAVTPAESQVHASTLYRRNIERGQYSVVPVEGISQTLTCATTKVIHMAASPTVLQFQARADGDSWLFMAIAWHPSWQAYRNGRPVRLHRAAGYFMAVPIGRGKHHLVLVYEPRSVLTGAIVSAVAWVAFAVLGLLGGLLQRD